MDAWKGSGSEKSNLVVEIFFSATYIELFCNVFIHVFNPTVSVLLYWLKMGF